MSMHSFSDKESTTKVIFVLLAKIAFSDVLEGVISKSFAHSARVVEVSLPLYEQILHAFTGESALLPFFCIVA